MLPSDVARSIIASVVAAALVGLPLSVAALAVAIARHRPARALPGVVLGFVGLIAGYGLLITGMSPVLRAALIVGVLVAIGAVLVAGRVMAAGVGLIATALPWTLFALGVGLDAFVAGRRIDGELVLPPFVAGLVAIAVGVSLIRFQRGYLARHPEAATPEPPPVRVWDAASRIVFGPIALGLNRAQAAAVACVVVGTQATVTVGHGQAIIESLAIVAAGSIATGLAAVLAWALVWPPRTRRAVEAFIWVGEWELNRFRDLTGGALSPSLANMKRHVRNNAERPEDRWIRVEALVVAGDLDGARAMAGRIPVETPVGRAEQASYLAYIDWLAGGPGDSGDLRAAAAAIEPADGDDRLRAEVAIAMAELRRRIAAGDDDPAAPLREVRDRLGGRADGVLFVGARRMVAGYLKLATILVVAVTLIDRSTSV